MVVCANCGADNRDTARFCDSCGAALEEAVAPRQSRKVVTALFCDVTGSTALGEDLDPEVLRGVLNRYFAEMRGIIERHGGTVEKFIGDAVMAVFGIPTVHEDDALRAVRAAAEIRERLPAIAQDVGVELRFRTGVNTGPVLVGEGENLAVGDAVNVAARLEQAADPGEIVIGEETLALVRNAVQVEALEPLDLKGKSEPVPAFRLLSMDPDAPGVARHLDARLVGRDRELALVRQAWDRAVLESGCHLFTLIGEAGVGKSRLVGELLSGIAQGASVLRGRCLHYGEGITFWPLVEALMPVGGLAQPVIERLSSGGAAVPEELFWDVRRLLEELAAERPVLLHIDDLQWAEPMLLDLLDHVADLSRGAAILLLCTARPDLLDIRTGWGGGKLNATTVLLAPLSGEDSMVLLEELGDGLDREARARVIEASEGNPLFLEEMVALAGERGTVEVPPTIQALLTARLEGLPPEERELLERGAVEGEVFHRLAVRALAGERLAAELGLRLAGLVRKELIRPHPATFKNDEAFRFRHLLIRDAAYDTLPKATRADLHERFANWLEANAGDLVELDEIAGWHLEQAVRYLRELGRAVAPDVASRAAAHLYSAGRRAGDRSDVPAASNLLERALALSAPDDPLVAEISLALADQHVEAGEFARAEELVALAEQDPAVGPLAVLTRLNLMINTRASEALREIEARLESLLEEFTSAGNERGIAKAHVVGFLVHLMAAQSRRAAEEARLAALHAARAGDVGLQARALGWYATELAWGPESADTIERELDEIERGSHAAYVAAILDLSRGEVARLRGELDLAAGLSRQGVAKLEGLGVRPLAAAGALHVALGEFSAQRPAAAVEALLPADAVLAELGERSFRSTIQALLAWAYSLVPEPELALTACDASLELSAPEDVINYAIVPTVRARLARLEGNLKRAEELAREGVANGAKTDYVSVTTPAQLELACALAGLGRREEAETAAREAFAQYRSKGDQPGMAQALEFLEAP
jgi:class 3 adenylate cyclase